MAFKLRQSAQQILAMNKSNKDKPDPDRVIYARKAGEEKVSKEILEGEKIDLETACKLKDIIWGSSNCPPKGEWEKQGLILHTPDQLFAYGVKCPKNGVKNFLMTSISSPDPSSAPSSSSSSESPSSQRRRSSRLNPNSGLGEDGAASLSPAQQARKHHSQRLQAMAKKGSQSKGKGKPGAPVSEEPGGGGMGSNAGAGKAKSSMKTEYATQTLNSVLTPNDKMQIEMVVGGLADLLLKVAEGNEAVFCLPGVANCFEPTAHYGIDGITEKLLLMKSKKEDELRTIIRKHISQITAENGSGLICVLYSLVLSRSVKKCVEDLQDQHTNALIDPIGESTLPLITLVILGKAIPYLHNGIMIAGEDEFAGMERKGVEGRSEFGVLLFEKDEATTEDFNLGSRLKTPVLPIWITRCNGSLGILFNPNKELMRSYHAENRFQLFYYSDHELKKDERKQTILTIDTRGINTGNGAALLDDDRDNEDLDDAPTPPLEKAIQTKWDGCEVDWNGTTPYV